MSEIIANGDSYAIPCLVLAGITVARLVFDALQFWGERRRQRLEMESTAVLDAIEGRCSSCGCSGNAHTVACLASRDARDTRAMLRDLRDARDTRAMLRDLRDEMLKTHPELSNTGAPWSGPPPDGWRETNGKTEP